MSKNHKQDLGIVYAWASVSAVKHRLQAARAKTQKDILKEKQFTALAFSMEIQARRILMHLRGKIEETLVHMEKEMEQAHELFSKYYPVMAEDAEKEGKKTLSELYSQLASVAKDHYDLLKIIPTTDLETLPNFYICSVCGHIEIDEIPVRCPICNAVPERFKPI